MDGGGGRTDPKIHHRVNDGMMSLTYFSQHLLGIGEDNQKLAYVLACFVQKLLYLLSFILILFVKMNDFVSRAMLFLKCDGWSFVDFVALCSCFWFTGSNKTGEVFVKEIALL